VIPSTEKTIQKSPCSVIVPSDEFLKIVKKYGDRILLKESDRRPKTSKKKAKKWSSTNGISNVKHLKNFDDWKGIPPWDPSVGGDGYPKKTTQVEGLAKHLRCVGMDDAIPYSKKHEQRFKRAERRVLLTRDAKLLRYEYLINNQIYKVTSLLKNEQLLE
ncbi:hypothetical protein HN51_047289, partial [Arachis hypogaea]